MNKLIKQKTAYALALLLGLVSVFGGTAFQLPSSPQPSVVHADNANTPTIAYSNKGTWTVVIGGKYGIHYYTDGFRDTVTVGDKTYQSSQGTDTPINSDTGTIEFHLGEWNDARYDGGTMEFYKLKYIHFICEWDTKEAYNTYLNSQQHSDSPFQQQYWVIFTEGYRSNRLEASTVDSTLPSEQLHIVWNRSMTLNDMSGSGRCEQYYFDNNTWVNIGDYGRLTDWATNVIASNLDIYDSGGNLIIPKTSYSDLDWNVINTYK